ncbi:uncharacterized protein PHACADRAFT_191037 [Phanerochaete carnosa HHB-10118-sp]|uniref:Uncharacterized protein n=1 Tax=Phanerochaete carnosa (strain HHB-10118-sp) TaxID=650164 RepID=K5WQW8_PHACS|nr:uncharacterized protein PHACADRAFT_191037 [Phanerochaete carnosa HHB-10118-sp]EKM61845.1 hypothetical protein PHACADRAFT_191037 [Phanerochaete carnosa HHB-10118-sp]
MDGEQRDREPTRGAGEHRAGRGSDIYHNYLTKSGDMKLKKSHKSARICSIRHGTVLLGINPTLESTAVEHDPSLLYSGHGSIKFSSLPDDVEEGEEDAESSSQCNRSMLETTEGSGSIADRRTEGKHYAQTKAAAVPSGHGQHNTADDQAGRCWQG